MLRGITKALKINACVFDVSKIGNSVVEIIILASEQEFVLGCLSKYKLEVLGNLNTPEFGKAEPEKDRINTFCFLKSYQHDHLFKIASTLSTF